MVRQAGDSCWRVGYGSIQRHSVYCLFRKRKSYSKNSSQSILFEGRYLVFRTGFVSLLIAKLKADKDVKAVFLLRDEGYGDLLINNINTGDFDYMPAVDRFS